MVGGGGAAPSCRAILPVIILIFLTVRAAVFVLSDHFSGA